MTSIGFKAAEIRLWSEVGNHFGHVAGHTLGQTLWCSWVISVMSLGEKAPRISTRRLRETRHAAMLPRANAAISPTTTSLLKPLIGLPSNVRPHWRGASEFQILNWHAAPRPVQAAN